MIGAGARSAKVSVRLAGYKSFGAFSGGRQSRNDIWIARILPANDGSKDSMMECIAAMVERAFEAFSVSRRSATGYPLLWRWSA